MSFRLNRFRRWLYLTTALLPCSAFAQGSVQQSGVVVASDFACWSANGIINDCGISSLNPISLPSIASGSLLGNATGSAHAAQETTLTALIDTLGSAAQGDILYRNGTAWVFLAPGTSGYYLKTQGAGANPTWDVPGTNTYTGSASITLTGTAFSITAPVSVANGGLGLTSGTAGGIPAYTTNGIIVASPLLTAHGVMLGGGSGATPTALTSLGTSGQFMKSNGASADPSWATPTSGTVTQINTGSCLSGGAITATGTISAVAAASGVCGSVTPDTNAQHFLNGAGTWTNPVVANGGITLNTGTISLTSPNLTGTTGSIGGSSLAAAGCSTGTVAIVGATTAMAVALNPVTYPGDAAYWKGYVSSAGIVTVANCIVTAGTPAASIFQVRVIQ